ncbi:MAG: hypothetical protein AMXMBFR6_15690 [Betaproteobacteria bacterium]
MVAHANAFVDTGGCPTRIGRPTLVFVHGALQDHACWLLQSRWFAHHGYNVIAPDLPGHGRTAGPSLADATTAADWLMQLVSEHTESEIALIGHSMGSLIALSAAARNPRRVRALALIGTAHPMQVSEALRTAARTHAAQAVGLVNRWSHFRGHFGGSALPGLWLYGLNQRLMERAESGLLAVDLDVCHSYCGDDALAALVEARTPTLIIAGQRDQMTPARSARALARQIPEGRYVELNGVGHALMTEAPDSVLDTLRDFLTAALPPAFGG